MAVRGRHGAKRAAKAFGLADGGAQSPAESALRVRLILRGFPRPRTQFPVTVAEYDGLWHHEIDQFHRDRRRLNLLSTAGWIVIHVTGRRMSTDFADVVSELTDALKLRGWNGRLRPERQRS